VTESVPGSITAWCRAGCSNRANASCHHLLLQEAVAAAAAAAAAASERHDMMDGPTCGDFCSELRLIQAHEVCIWQRADWHALKARAACTAALRELEHTQGWFNLAYLPEKPDTGCLHHLTDCTCLHNSRTIMRNRHLTLLDSASCRRLSTSSGGQPGRTCSSSRSRPAGDSTYTAREVQHGLHMTLITGYEAMFVPQRVTVLVTCC